MRLKSLILSLTVVGAMALPLLYTAPAQAQASRTWVSGVGDDANPCSRTAPCKTFAGAISKTANGGEIDALDPGGFGALTITKSITLDGGGGQVASILVAGTNGIVVNGGSSDVIIIRNLRFDGLRGAGNANAGLAGIKFLTGANLIIENCDLFGFNTAGIQIAPSASGGSVMISSTQVQNNAIGILMDGTGGSVNASLREVVSTENAGDGIQVNGGIHAGLTLDHGTSSFNGGRVRTDRNTGRRRALGLGAGRPVQQDNVPLCEGGIENDAECPARGVSGEPERRGNPEAGDGVDRRARSLLS